MHYFENVIVPNNQKSNYLFSSERKNDNIKGNIEHVIKIHQEWGFDFFLQYVNCDTGQRSGNLTFPKGVIKLEMQYAIKNVINCRVRINIKINSAKYDGRNNAKPFVDFKIILVL